MHIQEFSITNVGSIEQVEMNFYGRNAGWHVIIGENGAGKSSIISGLALALSDLNSTIIRYCDRPNDVDNKGVVSTVLKYDGASAPCIGNAPFFAALEKGADLDSAIEWLKELSIKEYDDACPLLNHIISFINTSELLPNGVKIDSVDSEGVLFGTNNYLLSIKDLGTGSRAILGIVLGIIRQLVDSYGIAAVFAAANPSINDMSIDVPCVVLIDGIDAHLHPNWQIDIGIWFTRYFPQTQFIVTANSPLVCRAAENGSIWLITYPNGGSQSREVTGVERDRLLYGNVLDAFGTELFGNKAVLRSEQTETMRKQLGSLNIKFVLGKITDSEEQERLRLQKIFTTDAPTGF